MKKAKHVDSLSEFARELEVTVAKKLPTNRTPFQKAAILAIDFSSTDISVEPLREELLDIFKTTYGWTVDKHTVDSSTSLVDIGLAMSNKMNAFIAQNRSKNEKEKALLVYYFSGHGIKHHTSNELIVW